MFCPHCGTENPDDATYCVECAKPLAADKATHQVYAPPPYVPPVSDVASPQTPPQRVQNHLVLAIAVTVLCCLPFGIVAIIFAAQVNGKLAAGDYAGAVEASNKAKMWSIIAAVAGLLFGLVYFLVVIAGQSGF